MGHRQYLKHIDEQIPKLDPDEYDRAVFILHDQLNLAVWPQWINDEKPLLIFIESQEKGNEIIHHKKKAIYVLSAMRHFALECFEGGYPVLYHSTNGSLMVMA
ncbi:MAG: cryptochrome/photolyase family protein [Balneolaceae bacterium]|nr:cryptochrome/photolyase family protein [Balneolaceae bacterium]